MRDNKKAFVVACILGSFFVYCGQAAFHPDGPNGGPSHDGFMSQADAQATGGGMCCTPPTPGFKKIAEGDLVFPFGGPPPVSPPIAVAAYREVVVYLSPELDPTACRLVVAFRPDANTPFGNVSSSGISAAGRLRVDGTDLQIMPYGCGNSVTKLHYSVAGVM